MSTPPAPTRPPPDWDYCRQGADPATDPVGCRGCRIPGHTACLAHLTEDDRAAYLERLKPGADIDHRGTPFTETLLTALLRALTDPSTDQPHLGTARFDEATFSGDTRFNGVTFSGDTSFDGVTFSGVTHFGGTFSGDARFNEATFSGDTWFGGSTTFARGAWFSRARFASYTKFGYTKFIGDAGFAWATFSGDAEFGGATFTGDAEFNGARFTGHASFGGATFARAAGFGGARFAVLSRFGPLACAQEVDLSDAVFAAPVTIEIAAREARCVGTRWESKATLRLRYATVDLSDAVLSASVAVTATTDPFTVAGTTVDERKLRRSDPAVRAISVQGVDTAHLVLTDTDLSECRFSGAIHLDQIRLEGLCTFATTPTGLHRRGIWPYCWWARRNTLAEEQHWRALPAGNPALSRGWQPGPHHPDPGLSPRPKDVAATYRQLRKAFEDGKNEPGAADFYYGEMEMRRHDRQGTPRAERGLLWAYWLLSGYGLRASRALLWLGLAMTGTVLALMLWGLPTTEPLPSATGTTTGNTLSLSTNRPDLSITGDRWTLQRADRAILVSVNAVVFRTSGQNLTHHGAYIEMVSRIVEPILLALAVLAVRERVKR